MVLAVSLCACSKTENNESSEKEYIENTLNLANNENQEWSYSKNADAWVLSVVSAVAYPELPDQQGVSVCVPGDYVTGIDTDGDGKADVTSADVSESVKGSLVIDYGSQITSTNGQEDYVFGSSEKDARHWDTVLLEIFEKYADILEPLFNK